MKLSPHEFDLLRVLAQNQGKLLTHRMLLREVWGPAYQVEAHYLHVYISHLRRKIEPDPTSPRYLLTEPGAGYRLVDPGRRLSDSLGNALGDIARPTVHVDVWISRNCGPGLAVWAAADQLGAASGAARPLRRLAGSVLGLEALAGLGGDPLVVAVRPLALLGLVRPSSLDVGTVCALRQTRGSSSGCENRARSALRLAHRRADLGP